MQSDDIFCIRTQEKSKTMIKELTATVQQTVLTEVYQIVLFNDDYNTFDWVIKALVEVCDHNPIQAEQCAMIVHYKGKYTIKSGEKDDMINRCIALLDRGLTAEVQESAS